MQSGIDGAHEAVTQRLIARRIRAALAFTVIRARENPSAIFRTYLSHAVAAIVCLAIAGCATSPSSSGMAFPRSGPPGSTESCESIASPPPALAKQPGYRQVLLSVRSKKNLPIPKLTARNLRLSQDGKQQKIAFFQRQPAAVGILVDTSGSMQGLKLDLTRQALEAFIHDLDPSDEIFLVAFSDRPFLLAPLTTDHARVIQDLNLLHAFGRTAIYDTVLDGLVMVSRSCIKTKAILLITDGHDTASDASLNQTSRLARKDNVPIYSIGIGNPKAGDSFWLLAGTDQDALDAKPLHDLATDTGGETFIITLDPKGAALKQAAAVIAGRIDSRYVAGFVGDGSTSRLRIAAPGHRGLAFTVESAKS